MRLFWSLAARTTPRLRLLGFDVPPQPFTTPPKVTSSVVHIVPRTNPLPADVKKLGRVTEAAFGQRL